MIKMERPKVWLADLIPRKKTLNKHEKRRIARQYARKAQGKPPLATPLKIAGEQERNQALANGKMVFYDGHKRIELPLVYRKHLLQGVYKISDGSLVTFRAFIDKRDLAASLRILKIEIDSSGRLSEHGAGGNFSLWNDIGHMWLQGKAKGQGLGIKSASIAERHVRTINGGTHQQEVWWKFGDLYHKLGYKVSKKNSKMGIVNIEKSGPVNPKDDLSNWHSIEAIDPKTGKVKTFKFKVK